MRVVIAGGVLAFAGASALLLMTVRSDQADAGPAVPVLPVVNSRAPIRRLD